MAWAFVQVGNSGSGGASSTTIVSFPATVGVGNFVAVVVLWGSATVSINSLTDDKGNVYTITPVITHSGAGRSLAIYYLWNVTNAPKTVTITWSTLTTLRTVTILEYSGIVTAADPKDVVEGQALTNPGTAADAICSSAGGTATALDSELALGAIMLTTTTLPTAGTGYTMRSTNTTQGTQELCIEEKDTGSGSAGTALRATATTTVASTNAAMLLATFKIPGAAGPVAKSMSGIMS